MDDRSTKEDVIGFREAIETDIPQLVQMISDLATHHFDTALITEEALRRDILGGAPWVHILVAYQEDSLLGYAALCPIVQLAYGLRGMDLHHLFVEESTRGKGIGRGLIALAVNKSHELGCAYLMVGTRPENTAARDFYLAYGFEDRTSDSPRFRLNIA